MNAKASVYLPFEGWALRSLSGSRLSTCTDRAIWGMNSRQGLEMHAAHSNAVG